MKAYGVADPRYPNEPDRQVRVWVARYPEGHFVSITAITVTDRGYRESVNGEGRRDRATYRIDTLRPDINSLTQTTALQHRAGRDAVALVAAFRSGDDQGLRTRLSTWTASSTGGLTPCPRD